MKAVYYLVYLTSKGDKNSASEAVLLGELPPELLDALEVDIKENNAINDVGEIVLDTKHNLSLSEKERLDYLTIDYFWKRAIDDSNLTLPHLKNYYLRCNIDYEEADVWWVMTGITYPSECCVSRTIEEIQQAKRVIASIPECSDIDNRDNDAMVEYVLRLIRLYEIWLSHAGIRRGFTKREMLLYFHRCLASTGNNFSDEQTRALLNLNQKHKELIQLQPEQDSGSEEPYYELTDLGRMRANGFLKSLSCRSLANVGNDSTAHSTDAQSVIEHIKRLEGYREPPSFTLADLKPPCEENGDWHSAEDTEKILNDLLIWAKIEKIREDRQESTTDKEIVDDIEELKEKRPQLLPETALRTRRQKVQRLQDEQTGYWHGKDTKDVFFRYKNKNDPPEYFILGKKDKRFSEEYPRLRDSASDVSPSEVKFVKIFQK